MGTIRSLTQLPPSLLLLVFSSLALPCTNAAATNNQFYTIASFDSTQASGLNSACYNVYQARIPSCQPSDFSAINPCSASCITSLQNVEIEAEAACAGLIIPSTSMLSYFQSGTGVNQLCTAMKNVAVPTSTTQIPSTTFASIASQTPTSSVPAAAQSAATTTVPAGAGGVSFATEVPGDPQGPPLSKTALIAIAVGVVVGIVIMLMLSIMLYRKHYHRRGPKNQQRSY